MRTFTTVLAASILASTSVATPRAQVDQGWLRMWQEAQTHRPAVLATTGRLAGVAQPGAPLVLRGHLVKPDGRTPAAGAIVFGYQTDRDGIYYNAERPGQPWRLQGWARTNDDGSFEFRTVRPGPYPGGQIPAHIHLSVETREFGRQWTDEIRFDDDAFVTADERARSRAAGAFGPVRPVTVREGVQYVDVTIRLKARADF